MKNKLGFTLIKLLEVVMIIGILSDIEFQQYYYLINYVKVKSQMDIVKNIVEAEQCYYLVNGQYLTIPNDYAQGEHIKGFDLELPNIPNITYSLGSFWVLLFNRRTDICIDFIWEYW